MAVPVRYRFGKRCINRVLHTMAIVQLRHDIEGRCYFNRRKPAGETSMAALRAPKRRLSDVVFRQMIADDQLPQAGLRPPSGPVGDILHNVHQQEFIDLEDVLDNGVDQVVLTGSGGQAGRLLAPARPARTPGPALGEVTSQAPSPVFAPLPLGPHGPHFEGTKKVTGT